jgi:acylaminoacyl-peptidase
MISATSFVTITAMRVLLLVSLLWIACTSRTTSSEAIISVSTTCTSTRVSSSRSSSVASKMSASATSVTATEDTEDFHQYAAAAVDLSNIHVSESSGTLMLSLIRSVRDWDNECRQSYLYQLPLELELDEDNTSTSTTSKATAFHPILMDKSIHLRLLSPSGKRTVIVKKPPESDKNKKPLVEIWEGASLVRRIAAKLHGPILNDPTGFGTPTWSPDENCLLYTAERFRPATSSFWDTSSTTTTTTTSTSHRNKEELPFRGGQNVLGQGRTEEWGEKYTGLSPLLDLFVLNLNTGKVDRVVNVPGTFDKSSSLNGVTLGQPVWHPNQPKIAYTGWDAGELGEMPRRLGMIFCRNRASQIYVSDISHLLTRLAQENEDSSKNDDPTVPETKDGNYVCVTSDYRLSRSPLYTPLKDGTIALLFLANPEGFVSHDGCMGLFRSDDSIANIIQTIIPVVQIPSTTGPKVQGMGFPGLFLSQLPPNCAIGKQYLVTSTSWGSMQRIIRVDIFTGAIELVDIPEATPLSSHSVLCQTPSGDLIVSEVAFNRPARLWHISGLLKNTSETSEDQGTLPVEARLVSEFSSMAATAFSEVQPKFQVPVDVHLLSIKPPSIDGATNEPIQALLLLPKTATRKNKVPLVVIPHGGPHACTVSNFAPGLAYLASHYAVILPNYRGSTGFGQASLESLLSRIGQVDVQDVMACTNHVIEQYSEIIDTKRIGICGGSHGGYLTAHLTGQFPDYFRAAVMRNPVTNIASMVTATDIADWCYGECLGSYDFSKFRVPTAEQLTKMYEKSPIVHLEKVTTPTLVALGMVDLRVPPSQGKEWYHSLRSMGVDTELLVYPEDCHALDKVTTEADHWIHIKRWFDKYFSLAAV